MDYNFSFPKPQTFKKWGDTNSVFTKQKYSGNNSTKLDGTDFKAVPSVKEKTPTLTSDFSSFGNYYAGAAPTKSGGASGIDLTPILSAFKSAADVNKDVVTNEGKTKRSSLLESIKRIQEDALKGRNEQRVAYQQGRGDIEGQNFLANRSIKASKAAKGIGGSGLEDIAILQNAINAGNVTSDLANKNITANKDITTTLNRYEQDNSDQVLATQTEEALKLRGIDSTLAEQIASANLSEKQRVSSINASNASNYANSLSDWNYNKQLGEELAEGKLSTASDLIESFRRKGDRVTTEDYDNTISGILSSLGGDKFSGDKNILLNQLDELKNKYIK